MQQKSISTNKSKLILFCSILPIIDEKVNCSYLGKPAFALAAYASCVLHQTHFSCFAYPNGFQK